MNDCVNKTSITYYVAINMASLTQVATNVNIISENEFTSAHRMCEWNTLFYSLPLSPRLPAVLDGGMDTAVVVTVVDTAVVVTVVDAAVVVRAVDAAVVVVVDAGAAVVVVVTVSVLLVDSNAVALPDGSRIAATIAGMSSVVNGLGAVFEWQLHFGGGNSAEVLFVCSDDWESARDRREFLTPEERVVRLPILYMIARACAHALIF